MAKQNNMTNPTTIVPTAEAMNNVLSAGGIKTANTDTDLSAPATNPFANDNSNTDSDITSKIPIVDEAVQGAKQFQTGFQQTVKSMSNEDVGSKLSDLGRGILNEASGATNVGFSPVSGTLGRFIINPLAKIISDVGNKVGLNGTPEQQQQTQNEIKAHPVMNEVLNNLTNLVMLGVGAKIAPEAMNGISDMVDTIKNPEYHDPEQFTNPTDMNKSTETNTNTLKSRTSDATPSYNKNMNLTNVRAPDTIDENGTVVKGKIVPRIAGEGEGKFGARPVTTSASEANAGKELNNIKNYPDNGTALEKGLSVQKAISDEAENMRGSLREEDKTKPLDTEAEKSKMTDLVKSQLPDEIKTKIGYISKADQEELGYKGVKEQTPASKLLQKLQGEQTEENLMPKTASGRYYGKVIDAVNNYNGTREGKLDLRQIIDGAYENARGKLSYGSDSQNALDETHTDIRDVINKDLSKTTNNIDTTASLKKQMNLYRGLDVLSDKARAESETAYGRLEQKYPSLRNLSRIAQRQGIMLPIRIVEGAVGIGLIGTYLRKAIAGK